MKKYFIFLCTLTFMLAGCNNDDDVVVSQLPEEQEETKTVADYPVQDFMWQTMNAYYFWQGDVPDLADDEYTDIEDTSYIALLGSYPDPEDFFYHMCNKHEEIVGEAAAIDRFSYTTDNYKELIQVFSGVSKSNGLQFSLGLYGNNGNVFGVVQYIVKDSDASGKDIKRGDFFIGVNGQSLNEDNYINLLFGNNDTYTLDMADLVGNTPTPNNKKVTLTKEENMVENPILVSKVIEIGGHKIGYLMYNSFVAEFDDELNEKFGEFVAAGVTDLILDFRYNGGGRVSSAIQIASAVYGAETEELFLRSRYNDKIQIQFSQNDLESNFVDKTYDNGIPLHTLGLSRVFIIATDRTASASELVMNGLAPYVQVVHVGSTTVGKNEFSSTFVDDPRNGNFYDPDREAYINPNNQWAIQPLLGRNENADGFSDYTNGLDPDYELEEDISNLGILGEPNELLLQKALDIINGTNAKRNFAPVWTLDYVGDSKMFSPAKNTMLMDGLLKPSIPN